MTRKLVLVHGRAQERKDPNALKSEWLDALAEGLAKNGLTLPIPESDVRFPYYGDTLDDLTGGLSMEAAADVVVRGEDLDDDEKQFTRAVLNEICVNAGVTPQQIAKLAGDDVVERGPLNWAWSQAILRALDRHVPYVSAATIALLTRDVYTYLRNPTVRRDIDTGVTSAFSPGEEHVVVAHSLGTVVAYNVLGSVGADHGWRIPLFVTLGSPLAVTQIRKAVRHLRPACCPDCVAEWFNALDERDVVALYSLDVTHFPLDPAEPAITNRVDVENRTENRHGISGYLDDADVALRIHRALQR